MRLETLGYNKDAERPDEADPDDTADSAAVRAQTKWGIGWDKW
ncbi:MAG TPA: hypothetical protein VLY63_28965 [Anaerolineae bacterium]|nr:hypothetical protein [Anaerolineae bacterium]